LIATPKEGEHFTEFYILGNEGKADNYTTNYVVGESGTIIVVIVNHGYRPINYTMEIRLENKSLLLPENLQHISLASTIRILAFLYKFTTQMCHFDKYTLIKWPIS
jgi:uncharacterized membrane protein